jgi:hypothetical protein
VASVARWTPNEPRKLPEGGDEHPAVVPVLDGAETEAHRFSRVVDPWSELRARSCRLRRTRSVLKDAWRAVWIPMPIVARLSSLCHTLASRFMLQTQGGPR